MFMQKLRKTSLPKRKKKKRIMFVLTSAGKKFTGLKLNILKNKLLKNNNNKFLLLCLMPVGLFCNDDTTPPSPKNITQNNKQKQNRLTLLRYPILLFLLNFD